MLETGRQHGHLTAAAHAGAPLRNPLLLAPPLLLNCSTMPVVGREKCASRVFLPPVNTFEPRGRLVAATHNFDTGRCQPRIPTTAQRQTSSRTLKYAAVYLNRFNTDPYHYRRYETGWKRTPGYI